MTNHLFKTNLSEMNERMGGFSREPEAINSQEVQQSNENAEKNESFSVDNVYFAEELAENDNSLHMTLYSPQESVAIAKRFKYENSNNYSIEPTTLILNNPLRLSYQEYISHWSPGFEGTSMAENIRKAIEYGYDGLIVEANPNKQDYKKPEDYTYATETYYKFSQQSNPETTG
ncbi:hypothetical protein HY844_00570 [Candidatus Berkelbacteria bacterium]|nr:hypothetical protein [Candidatus Berkelbacteria bacterium]